MTADLADLERRLELERAARRSLVDLIDALAHGLRTPLGAVAHSAHLLRTDAVDPETLKVVAGIVDRSVASALAILEDVEELARLDGGIDLARRPADVVVLVQQAVVAIRPVALQKNVKLEIEAPAPASVHADEPRLLRALGALLGHVVEHAREGNRIGVRLRAGDPAHVLDIDDAGPSIPEDQRSHLFERDGRRARSRRRGGLGLGLAIARELVEAHGGRVSCEPHGESVVFRMELPRA